MESILKRNNLGQFIKGNSNPWNKGKKCPELGIHKIGVTPWNKGLKGWSKGTKAGFQIGNILGSFNKGRKVSPETIKRLRESHLGKMMGADHPAWKGDKVGYAALHDWVYSRLGKPTKCEHCGKDGLTSLQINWANKSGKYLRKLTDWIRLCTSCHGEYDSKKIKCQ